MSKASDKKRVLTVVTTIVGLGVSLRTPRSCSLTPFISCRKTSVWTPTKM